MCFHIAKHVLSDIRYRKTCVLTSYFVLGVWEWDEDDCPEIYGFVGTPVDSGLKKTWSFRIPTFSHFGQYGISQLSTRKYRSVVEQVRVVQLIGYQIQKNWCSFNYVSNLPHNGRCTQSRWKRVWVVV